MAALENDRWHCRIGNCLSNALGAALAENIELAMVPVSVDGSVWFELKLFKLGVASNDLSSYCATPAVRRCWPKISRPKNKKAET